MHCLASHVRPASEVFQHLARLHQIDPLHHHGRGVHPRGAHDGDPGGSSFGCEVEFHGGIGVERPQVHAKESVGTRKGRAVQHWELLSARLSRA